MSKKQAFRINLDGQMLKIVLRVLLILLLIPGISVAATNGNIRGTVVDAGMNEGLPGVVITITSDNMMGERQAQTGVNGQFIFAEVPPGNYQLMASRKGFTPIRRPNVLVKVGSTAVINLTMELEGAAAEIIVEETRNVIDTETGNQGSVLTKEFLQRIPAGRSYQAAAQLAVGVTGGSNPNVGGGSYNENSYLMDGVNITDPVTGTFSLNFNFDAIEQLQVLTSAYDPEFGQNLGGAINIVTDSGGNTLQFKLYGENQNGEWGPKRDDVFAADGTILAPTDYDSRFDTKSLSAIVSGPVIRDKLWFVGSYQYSRTLISLAGVDLPRDFDGHYILGKLTYSPNASHRITLLGQSDPTTIDNTNQGSRFINPEAQSRQAQGGWLSSLRWEWYISPEQFLETQATVQKTFIERHSVPCTHNQDLGYHPCEDTEFENSINYTTAPRVGIFNAFSSGNSQVFDFDDRWRAVFGSKYSILQIPFLGTHDIKAGLQTDIMVWDKIFGLPGNLVYYDLNEQSYNPDTFMNYYWYEYSAPLNYETFSNQLSAFFQDVYKPINNLTFRWGARYDRSIFRNDVGERIIDVGVAQPRVSIIWDPWADARTKIVANYGRFANPGRIGVADYLSQSGFGAKLYLGEYFSNHTNEANNTYYYLPPIMNYTIHDTTTAPRADEVSVGAEREVISDLAAKVYFTGKFTRNLYALDELNLLWDQDGYNIIGSANGTFTSMYRMRTPDMAERNYLRTDIGMTKVRSNRWEAQATYSYTISRGSVQNTPSSFLSVPQQLEYILDGYLGTDIRHDFTSGFSWDLPDDPWTTRLGATLFLESGYPLSRTYNNGNYGDFGRGFIYKDTVGTYARAATWWELNLLVQQALPVRKGKLWAIAQVDNITNQRVGQSAFVSFDNRWRISSRQNPIRFTLAGRYEF
ncbi:MAG: hypothetical protein CMK59_02970 [Proteobacteria bacterium]|nr:hypothetical protein [Pseudomonadota bacterium]